nr:alpha-hydroxy acid oxidase [Sphingomonas tagetis]
MRSLASWMAAQFDPRLSCDDVKRTQDRRGRPAILKGLMDAEDADRAASSGVAAIIVSNHGGRQLDGAPSSISALPGIAPAVGGKVDVLMDGGITSVQDVIQTLALRARGVLLGRSFVYGLGALGEAGVTRALEIIRRELQITMALCGVRDVKDVGRGILAA